MKLLNLLSLAAIVIVGFAAAVLPKDVSSALERSEASVRRLCPVKCRVIFNDCVNKELLGLDTCQQAKCQDSDCAQCDSECNKASSLMMASEAERRETVPEEAEEQEHTSENNPRDEMNLFGYGPEFCPKHCVGNRNACVEMKHPIAECNHRTCNGMCVRMCDWCIPFRGRPSN